MATEMVHLRRVNTGTPWGFRMNGGSDYRQPLYIQKVTPGGVAFKAGLRPGDGILEICNLATNGMTHEQAKMEILRAGNEVDFYVARYMVTVESPEENASSSEKATWTSSPVQDPAVQSRSFKVLQQSLRSE